MLIKGWLVLHNTERGMISDSIKTFLIGYFILLLGDTLLQAMTLLPLLKQSLERTQSQANLVAIVTEGLSAAYMMTLMYGSDTEAGKHTDCIMHLLKDFVMSLMLTIMPFGCACIHFYEFYIYV